MSRSKPKAIGSRGSRRSPPTNAFAKGNPGGPGRPKSDPELIEAFRARTPKALAVLDKVLDGYVEGPSLGEEGAVQAVKPQDAVRAAEVVLNRGWGTAPSTIKVDVDATVDAKVKADVETKTTVVVDPQRLARIAAVLQRAGVLVAGEAKDDARGDVDA